VFSLHHAFVYRDKPSWSVGKVLLTQT
jgi:hypothetical protein